VIGDGDKSGLPDRPIRLVEQVVSGDPAAWHQFVEATAGFLYSLAWRYARGDPDRAADLVVVALQGLRKPDADGQPFYRLRRYLDSLPSFGRRSRFITWLALVVKNLFRDWFREREGRRWLPKEIGELGPEEEAVFHALLWDGLSEAEAFHRLRARWPGMDEDAYDRLLDRVYRALSSRNLWNLYQDLLRRQPTLAVDETGGSRGEAVQVAERGPPFGPDRALEMKLRTEQAARIGRLLGLAIEALPAGQQQVVRLLALRGLSGEEVRRVLGYRKRQKVYDQMAKARRRLLATLTEAGVTAEQVEEVTGYLDRVRDGVLDEEKTPSGTRSRTAVRREQVDAPTTPPEEV